MSWMAFVEGFARTTSDIISQRREEAKDYKEKMREMAERNRSKIQAMNESVKQNQAFVTRARNLGASDAQISMALDTSPTALRDMVTTLTELKNNPATAGTFGPEMIARAYVVPEDYTNVNTDAAARFGTGSQVGDVEGPEDTGILGRLFNTGAMGTARADLDQEMLAGTNMSIFDAAGLGDFDFYNTLSPGTVGSFVEPQVMDAERTNTEMMRYLQKYKAIMETTEAQIESAFDVWKIQEAGRRQTAGLPALELEDQRAYKAVLQEQARQVRERFIAQHFATAGQDVIGYDKALAPLVAASGTDPLTQYAAQLLDPTFVIEPGIGQAGLGTSPETGGFGAQQDQLPVQTAEDEYDAQSVIPIYQRDVEGVAYYLEPTSGRMFVPGSRNFISNVDVRRITQGDPNLLSLTPDMSQPFSGEQVTDEMILGRSEAAPAPEAAPQPEGMMTPEEEQAAPVIIDMAPVQNLEQVTNAQDYLRQLAEEKAQMDADPSYIGPIGDDGSGSVELARERLEEAAIMARQAMLEGIAGSIPSQSEYVSAMYNERIREGASAAASDMDAVQEEIRAEWDAMYKGLYTRGGEAIIVEARPVDAEEAAQWDRLYGDTHNANGTPLPQRRGS